MTSSTTNNNMDDVFIQIVNDKYKEKEERNIWGNSKWAEISKLENDDVGKVGETLINTLCKKTNIEATIDGSKTKELNGGGKGDGLINGKSVEIKTARQGSKGGSFQHELGEKPWKPDYMLFFDISPDKYYITIFKNFNEEFYKESGRDSKKKCIPYFPTKSITHRKKVGAFKLDTTIKINEESEYTFIHDSLDTNLDKFRDFINKMIN